ncbi:TolC family protein [Parvibium lacunae]|uniref:TolC family protein n=1 Tax=Parvibium lacunae TaxID=1888893 RepID=UPI001313E1FF|nr:TolC family protein [Parvibium lacunae]
MPLSLANARQRLAEGNRELRQAKNNIALASADQASAAARPNPQLSYNMASINPNGGIGGGAWPDKRIDQIVRLDQLIERGNKRELRIAVSDANKQASEADYANTLREQRLALDIAYYDLKLAEQKLSITRDNAQLFADTLQKQQLRLQAGDIAGADLARIRVDALRAKSEQQQATLELRQAQASLALLLGLENCSDALQTIDPWPQLSDTSTASVLPDNPELDRLVNQRSDVVAAQQRRQAAQQAYALAQSLRSRDVSVNAQYERFQPNSPNTYGIGVSVPLFLGYDYRGEIRRAQASLDQADYELQKTQQIAAAEIRQAQQRYQLTRNRWQEYQEQILPAARKATQATEFAWRNGAASLLDWLDARRTLRAVELDAAQIDAQLARARAVVQATLGLSADSPPRTPTSAP